MTIREILYNLLEKEFVPMDKWQRLKYEHYFNKYNFPLKEIIRDIWHTDIKNKYPDVWRYPEFNYGDGIIIKKKEGVREPFLFYCFKVYVGQVCRAVLGSF